MTISSRHHQRQFVAPLAQKRCGTNSAKLWHHSEVRSLIVYGGGRDLAITETVGSAALSGEAQ